MIVYLRPAKGRVVHATENGLALCGAGIVAWAEEEHDGFSCGLCGSRLAIRRKLEKLSLKKQEARP